jgi:P27 family predicted phage terminase small subunit
MPRGGRRNFKPTHLKVISGTHRADRDHGTTPKPRPIIADCPNDLYPHATRTWAYVVPILTQLGVLTEADHYSLIALCDAWGRYMAARDRAREVLKQQIESVPDRLDLIRKSEVSVERAEFSYRQWATEFGLTPAARNRLDVHVSSPASDSEADELDRLMRAHRERG